MFSGSGLALLDGLSEFTEGFLLYLDIDENNLDARDRERLQTGNFKVVNPLVVVSIPGSDRKSLYFNISINLELRELIVCMSFASVDICLISSI